MKSALRAAISVFTGLSIIAGAARGAEPSTIARDVEPVSSVVGEQAAAAAAAQPTQPVQKPVKVTISKETTYLTEPLRPDGYVDYVAALNQECSAGVTPENNAAVLLWQAFDSSDMENREAYFQALGVPAPPMEAPHFTYHYELPDDDSALRVWSSYKQMEVAQTRPWSKTEFPVVAQWLAMNEVFIPYIVDASRRPRCYSPIVISDDRPLIGGLILLASQLQEGARVLRVRAMRRLQGGDISGAIDDLMACHRIARLADQRPTLIDGLIACSIERPTCQCDVIVAHFGRLTSQQIRGVDSSLVALGAFTSFADRIDHGERIFFLNSVTMAARRGVLSLGYGPFFACDRANHGVAVSAAQALFDALIDWNEPLRMGNQWYDRVATAGRLATLDRLNAFDAIEWDLGETKAALQDPGDAVLSLFQFGLRRAVGRKFGQAVICQTVPGFLNNFKTETELQVVRDETHVALMLEAWRADHDGTYPAKLDELAPAYLPQLPLDPWSNAPYRYRPGEDGYLIYSVGPNQYDDQGWNESRDNDPRKVEWHKGDDIALRMPPQE